MKPVYLYGFMGCGKSYLGRKAARELGLSFADLDEYIIEREGMEISEIFAEHGEERFRAVEFAALRELGASIISLGGGALTAPEASEYAKKHAVVVFIDTGFEVCCERVRGDNSRPNAANKTAEELRALYEARAEHYKNAADYTIREEQELISLLNELFSETGDDDENL
jgi:shikimate kinase